MPRSEPRALLSRIVSALALAPPAIAAVWFGSPWLPLLTAAAAAGLAWEWGRLCSRTRCSAVAARFFRFMLAGVAVAVVAVAALAGAGFAIATATLGAAMVFRTAGKSTGIEQRWAALGVLWVALPCVALLWLAEGSGARVTLLWVLAIVWATDIGAYAIGRSIGGPRLAPRLSPRKTWAGLIGGTLCAALAGAATARVLGISPAVPLVLVSAGLAIVGQVGDLAESLAKRRFGVKDSSGLIPGHGGLLDRLDSLLAVLPAVALLSLVGGRSVLAWR